MKMNVMGTPPNNFPVEQASTTKLAPNKGADLDLRVLSDGTVAHNIAYPSTLGKGARAEIDKALGKLADEYSQIDGLIAEAKAKGMDGLVKVLETNKSDIETKLEAVKKHLEGPQVANAAAGPVGDLVVMNACVKMLNVNKLDLDGARARIEQEGGSVPAVTTSNSAVEEMKGSGSAAGSTGIKGSDGSDLSADQARLMEMPPAQLHNAFASDPDGVWKTIVSLPPQDRNQVMQGLQMAIQQDNQLQSMLSNFMKSLHDTAKAQISNLRV